MGAGRWGKNIIDTLRTLPDCKIVYIEKRDYRRLVKKQGFDAVVVATPGSTHARVALPFIKRGLLVFIEKPMTTSLKDAKMLAEAAKKSGSLVFVGHIQLYNPAYVKTKELIKKIGTIRFILGEGSNNGPYRDDMSAFWDHAPHDISMMLDILGKMPKNVEAWGVSLLRPQSAIHDIAYAKLTFPNGIVGFIFNTWIFPEKRRRLVVVGKKSTVVFDHVAQKRVLFYENMGPLVKESAVIRKEPKISYPKYNTVAPLEAELRAFLEMVRTNKKPKTDVVEGLEVVRVLDAAEKSIRAGGKVIQIKKQGVV